MKMIANPLQPGDVIQTHPLRGFWGCAIVLTARHSTDTFHPMRHIAITTHITKRKYAWSAVDPQQLEIVRFTPRIRVAPNEYLKSVHPRTCIGMYSLKSAVGLSIIGTMDPSLVYDAPLTFEVGDGTQGTFPLCGPIQSHLGNEAVAAWRELHDAEGLAQQRAQNAERFEQDEKRRLSANRLKSRAGGI